MEVIKNKDLYQKRSSCSNSVQSDNANLILQQNTTFIKQKKIQLSNQQRFIKNILLSVPFQIFITLLTLVALFSDDVRAIAFSKSTSLSFDILNIIMITIFFIEVILSWIVIPQYRLSFFMILDIVSAISLLFDIDMLTDLIYANPGSSNFSKLADHSKAARVATRAVRIVKLFRIIRIAKLYKTAVKAKEIKQRLKLKKMLETKYKQENKIKQKIKIKETNQTIEQLRIEQINEKILTVEFLQQIEQNQSKISKVLSDITIKKVVLMVLLLIFTVPLFDVQLYNNDLDAWEFLSQTTVQMLRKSQSQLPLSSISNILNQQIEKQKNIQNYILYFSSPFAQLPKYSHSTYANKRISDVDSLVVEINNITSILAIRPSLSLRNNLQQSQKQKIYIIIDIQSMNIYEGCKYYKIIDFSIGKTLFVSIILIVLLQAFSSTINEIIVQPIEKMMKNVIQIAKNPQKACQITHNKEQYQISVVHNAIVKIGSLLSLVFGNAGAQIIGSNIMQQGDMNPLIGGNKKCAIFGFCDIHHFAQATEALQEDIMIFVNTIASLVHSSVYRYGGNANKNIGQAFLLVWSIPQDVYTINQQTNEITWHNHQYLSILSDFSILSFVKTIIKINKDPQILQYKNNKNLLDKFGPDYKIKMGFGLHLGWAIQGAIGSDYKIDASYLSPNVNMASRLQAAAKQYNVQLLISETLYNVCTSKMKNYLRNIDRVTVKGSKNPLRLYTVDLNLNKISKSMNKEQKYKNKEDIPVVQFKKEKNMQFLKEEMMDQYDAQNFITNKKQMRQVMKQSVSKQFKQHFQLGLDAYLKGNWQQSRKIFQKSLTFHPNDGPTYNILKYMGKFSFQAPKTWNQYRQLTEK